MKCGRDLDSVLRVELRAVDSDVLKKMLSSGKYALRVEQVIRAELQRRKLTQNDPERYYVVVSYMTRTGERKDGGLVQLANGEREAARRVTASLVAQGHRVLYVRARLLRSQRDVTFEDLKKLAIQQGWRVERTKQGHWKFYPADKAQKMITVSGHHHARALKNAVADLIRAGLLINPGVARAHHKRHKRKAG